MLEYDVDQNLRRMVRTRTWMAMVGGIAGILFSVIVITMTTFFLILYYYQDRNGADYSDFVFTEKIFLVPLGMIVIALLFYPYYNHCRTDSADYGDHSGEGGCGMFMIFGIKALFLGLYLLIDSIILLFTPYRRIAFLVEPLADGQSMELETPQRGSNRIR